MSNISYYGLQKAIYDKLTENTPLMAIVSGVFDYPPQQAIFPFVSIGKTSFFAISSLLESTVRYQFDINVFSRESGHKQVSDIIKIIYELLHNGSISVAGKTLVAMRCEGNTMELENDGWTYRASLRLSVVLRDN